MWFLALFLGCDEPADCPPDAIYSRHFGQCIGELEPSTTTPPLPTAATGDTGT